MRMGIFTLLATGFLASATTINAQTATPPSAVAAKRAEGQSHPPYFIPLGGAGEGVLYEPSGTPDPIKSRIALVSSNFSPPSDLELTQRGYRVMNVNPTPNNGAEPGGDRRLGAVSQAVGYMRQLPGVQRVIIIGHSGGANEMALYENVAENGAAACNGPEKIYPCRAAGLDKLQKPDGAILIDPPLGALHSASSLDPAVSTSVNQRDPALDMFSPANGFNSPQGAATYSAEFAKRFYAAQVARNLALQTKAVERLKAIEAGTGDFANDEPMTIPGLGVATAGARLFQTDPTLLSHTKAPHMLLKADGTRPMTIIRSVRSGITSSAQQVRTLGIDSKNTTIRGYLAADAIRLRPDFAITADDVVGVDWNSAYESPISNAAGIKAPTLVMAMGCHYLMVPAEKIYDSLAAKDKFYVAVDGATHIFTPCKPEYGDTNKRTFDFVDEWLLKAGRF